MTGFAVNVSTNPDIDSGFNDMYIDAGGLLVTVSGVEEFIQSIRSSVWLWLGEYEYNTTLGVAYKAIFANPHVVSAFIIDQLKTAVMLADSYLTTDQRTAYGVKKIESIDIISIDKISRKFTFAIVILLNNSQILNIES